jgi:hypothetical protein
MENGKLLQVGSSTRIAVHAVEFAGSERGVVTIRSFRGMRFNGWREVESSGLS